MVDRKIGAGFNYPRVLLDRERPSLAEQYDLMRRLTRLPLARQRRRSFWWQTPIAASVVETMRLMRRD